MKSPLFAAAVCGMLTTAAPLHAQSTDPHDEIYDLAMVEADHDLCGFPLTDEQQDVIAQRRDALVTRGDVTEGEASAVREQVSAALARQKGDGLCRPNGPEANAYKRRLTTFGLL